ncbi:MAG: glycerol-3-phosphate acyltransferase [Anaerolineae bacterium]
MGLNLLAWAALGYFVGALPSAILATRLPRWGQAPPSQGGPANAVAVALDIAKGALLAWLASQFAWSAYAVTAVGFMAVVGQGWPVWTPKRGSTGLPTAIGALAVAVPAALLVGLAAWALVFALSRRPLTATLVAASLTPLAAALLHYPAADVLLALGAALVVLMRQRQTSETIGGLK